MTSTKNEMYARTSLQDEELYQEYERRKRLLHKQKLTPESYNNEIQKILDELGL